MLRKALATIAAATILVTAFAVAPADLKVGRGALLVDAPSPCLRLLGAGAVPREDTRGKKSRNYPSPFHGLPVPALEPWRCVAVK